MVHRVVWRVGSGEALDFWADRLAQEGLAVRRDEGSVRFEDPEGLGLEIALSDSDDPPLVASAPDIPTELALQGFAGVRAFSDTPERSEALLPDPLGFHATGPAAWEVRGDERGSFYVYDPAPEQPGRGGAGVVHHVAFSARIEDHEDWHRRVVAAGAVASPIIERFYFRSIYFREPSGVLFEIATLGPGFTADEPLEHLGERLSLPPDYEHLRPQIERIVTPLPNPRAVPAAR